MVCTEFKPFVQTCRHLNCPYTMCNRCLFLYQRMTYNNDLCPACRQDRPFEPPLNYSYSCSNYSCSKYSCSNYSCSKYCCSKYSCSNVSSCIRDRECRIQSMYGSFYTLGSILCLGVFCSVGGLVFYVVFPTMCCTTFIDFMAYGFVTSSLIICLVCLLCEPSSNEEE